MDTVELLGYLLPIIHTQKPVINPKISKLKTKELKIDQKHYKCYKSTLVLTKIAWFTHAAANMMNWQYCAWAWCSASMLILCMLHDGSYVGTCLQCSIVRRGTCVLKLRHAPIFYRVSRKNKLKAIRLRIPQQAILPVQ